MINWVLFVVGLVFKGLDHFLTYEAITKEGAREINLIPSFLIKVFGVEGSQIVVGISWVILTLFCALQKLTIALAALDILLVPVLIWNIIQFVRGLKH